MLGDLEGQTELKLGIKERVFSKEQRCGGISKHSSGNGMVIAQSLKSRGNVRLEWQAEVRSWGILYPMEKTVLCCEENGETIKKKFKQERNITRIGFESSDSNCEEYGLK